MLSMKYFFFFKSSKTSVCDYTYSTSSVGQATFEGLIHDVGLAAANPDITAPAQPLSCHWRDLCSNHKLESSLL